MRHGGYSGREFTLIKYFIVKKKSLEYRTKVVLWVFVLHSAQYRRLEALSLCLCVTNPF